MATVDAQIKISDSAICKLIDEVNPNKRGFLSLHILSQLRTLVEAVAVKASGEAEYSYDLFQSKGKIYMLARGKLKFLRKFHKSLQITTSHYQPDEENSERLMLKYYEYLIKVKAYLKAEFDYEVLKNIKKFPIKTDPAIKEYHEKIVRKIKKPAPSRRISSYGDRYYIRNTKPFFVDGEIYYEITFTTATDNVSKFNHVIAFSKFDILPNYAVKLQVSNDAIEVLGKRMPIQIIEKWEVSIRPCEFNNFAKILGREDKISTVSKEYRGLMKLLTKTNLNIVEIIEFPENYYRRFKTAATKDARSIHIFKILDDARELIQKDKRGANLIKYLLYHLNNKRIKLQYSSEPCRILSNLYLEWGCIPFDDMPFNTSPKGHNPKVYDLLDCLDSTKREHELFARFIKNNTEHNGKLYTPTKEVDMFENTENLISQYNQKVYHTHKHRHLKVFKDHIYIKGYESDTLEIIQTLKKLSSSGLKNYSNSVDAWLQAPTNGVDCEEKRDILKQIFANSHVGMIYGSAGTGKTTLINHISTFHKDAKKLYLANTNPAVNNLSRRINASNTTFQTIAKFLQKKTEDVEFDILFIDECSTVSNANMLSVLKKARFKLLILVGDVYQIESILFGNWFNIARFFLPEQSVFELTKPYRTQNEQLIELWDRVRNIKDNILEHITKNGYSTRLDESIFEHSEEDEIILCLNYDGLYGINNINKFLQGSNEQPAVQWGIHTYKVNDPILFNETNRFKPLIHNNLKGKIVGIKVFEDFIKFDIEIDKTINELDTYSHDLELIGESESGNSIIQFQINKLESTDEDETSSRAVVPFQVAYAVSMHKAQGLEYRSVKVVITDETEERITHNIFYTTITRAKENLKIFWSPETEKEVLANLETKFNKKDVQLLKLKFKL